MNRQESFEKHWAQTHDVPVESMAQYRWKDQDGYRLPGMAAHYRTFCAAMDSIPALKKQGNVLDAYRIAYPNAPLGCAWNSMSGQFEQSWEEHWGEFNEEYEAYNAQYQAFKKGWELNQ